MALSPQPLPCAGHPRTLPLGLMPHSTLKPWWSVFSLLSVWALSPSCRSPLQLQHVEHSSFHTELSHPRVSLCHRMCLLGLILPEVPKEPSLKHVYWGRGLGERQCCTWPGVSGHRIWSRFQWCVSQSHAPRPQGHKENAANVHSLA